jgi:hypothetical protein
LTEFVNPNNIQAHIAAHTNNNNNNNNKAKFPNPNHGEFTISSGSSAQTTTSIAVATPSSSSIESFIESSLSKTMIVDGAKVCTDTPDWVDKYNDTCEFYAKIDASTPNRCKVWGDKGAKVNKLTGVSLGVANDNCCICGGGSITTAIDTTDDDDDGDDDDENVAVVNPGGTCGKGRGDRGNGICANGLCCSEVRERE